MTINKIVIVNKRVGDLLKNLSERIEKRWRTVFHRGKRESERTRTISIHTLCIGKAERKLGQMTDEILDQAMPWNGEVEVKEQFR